MPEDFEYSVRTTREQARTFLEKLARDDDFRTEFEHDPRAAFEEYGITIPQSLIPERVVAPPKHYLEEALWVIYLEELESAGMRAPFTVPFWLVPFSLQARVPFNIAFGPLCHFLQGAIWRAQQPE